jgi:hypothetical protein
MNACSQELEGSLVPEDNVTFDFAFSRDVGIES